MNRPRFRFHAAPHQVLLALLLSAGTASALTLDELIGTALSNSPLLHAAAYQVAAAKAQAGQAASAWYPQVRTSANYARTDNPPQAFFMSLNQRTASLERDFNNPEDIDNLRLSASAGWLLFDGGQRSLTVAMAELGADAQRLARAAAINRLVHDVTRGCHGVLQARDAVTLAASSVKSLEESLRLANAQLQAGAAMRSDVLNLDVKLAEARQRQIQAQNGFALALASLNSDLGVDLVDTNNLPTCKSADAVTAVGGALTFDQRPEWQAAQLMTRLKQQALQKARRARSPTVSAFGSVDWDSDVSSDFEQSYLAGVAAELDVFDGHRRSQGIAQARADYEAARANEALAERQLGLDLTQARLQLDDARARRAVARAGVANAEEALRLARERYQQGAADISELLNAETAQTGSRTSAMAVDYEVETALSNLERAQGLLAVRYADSVKE